jgi:hypothetical protein
MKGERSSVVSRGFNMSDTLQWESDNMDPRSFVPERNAYLPFTW